MYRISKRFRFEASHLLPGLPPNHKCGRDHGHSYGVEVVLTSAQLSPPGFVVDFGDLAPVKAYIDSEFDHRRLNDVLDIAPTSENLARHFHEWCANKLALPAGVLVESVTVSETDSTWAQYAPRTAAESP